MDNKIGIKIASLRKFHNMSQKVLAQKLNVSNKTISKWECGKSVPDIEFLSAIAGIFNITIDELINTKNVSTQMKETNTKKKKVTIVSFIVVLALSLSILLFFILKSNDEPFNINSDLLDIDNKNQTMYCSLSNDTESISLLNVLSLPNNYEWKLYKNIECTDEIYSKSINLLIGDNNYFILIEHKNDKLLYELTLRRRPIYIVSFDTNGGNVINSISVEEGVKINESNLQKPSKIGYEFDLWEYDFSEPILKDLTIVATYKVKNYSINYILDNGQNDNRNPLTYNIEMDDILLYSPQKTGFQFMGWYSDDEFIGVQITEIIVDKCKEIKLYAKWSKEHKILYNLNGGINLNNAPNTFIKEDNTFYLKDPIREYYTFDGWYADNNFIIPIDKIENGTNHDVELFAKWYATEYTINYVMRFGENSVNNPSTYTIEDSAIELDIPTREGFTFCGWYDNNYKKIKSINVTEYKSTTIHATWGDTLFTYSNNSIIGTTEFANQLNDIEIPTLIDNVTITTIKKEALWYLTNVRSLCMSSSIIDIEPQGLFMKNVEKISIENNKYSVIDNCLIDKENNSIVMAYGNFIIPNHIEKIDDYAFKCCQTISELSFPKSISTIGNFAFVGCGNLTSVEIHNNITNIGTLVFSGCTSLSKIVVDTNNNYYESINNCLVEKHTQTILKGCNYSTIPDTARIIGMSAFADCSFEHINIPINIIKIESSAFSQCFNLKEIVIPDSVKTIGSNAFFNCTNLEFVKLPNDLEVLESGVFSQCFKLKDIELPDTLVKIEDACFNRCVELRSIALPSNLNSIGTRAFDLCERLSTIIIPISVVNIEFRAFVIGPRLKIIIFIENSNVPSTWEDGWDAEAIVYKYSESNPYSEGNYWHYDLDGITPIIWD